MPHNYSVNKLAVIFLPEIDRKNNFTTIVYSPETEHIIKINRFGYEILKVVDKTPGINLSQIVYLVSSNHKAPEWVINNKVFKFLDKMIKENVIVIK